MVVKVMPITTFEGAFKFSQCPYCGVATETVERHLIKCKSIAKNEELVSKLRTGLWARHEECGRVIILSFHRGLVMVENDFGRCVVPATDLMVDDLSGLIGNIEAADLSQDQLRALTAHLLMKCHDMNIVADLNKGNVVDIRLNERVQRATIQRKLGKNRYIASVDGVNLNIGRGDIIRLAE